MKTKKMPQKKPATKGQTPRRLAPEPSSPGRITDVVGTPGDTGLIIGDYFIAPGHKRMILMTDHKHDGVWLAGVGDHIDEDWYGSRAEFDAAGWISVNAKDHATDGARDEKKQPTTN